MKKFGDDSTVRYARVGSGTPFGLGLIECRNVANSGTRKYTKITMKITHDTSREAPLRFWPALSLRPNRSQLRITPTGPNGLALPAFMTGATARRAAGAGCRSRSTPP